MVGDLFFSQITSLTDFLHLTRNTKNLYMGSYKYFAFSALLRPEFAWNVDGGQA